MPSLERLHRTLGPEGLVVLGVSIDEDGGALQDFVKRAGVTFPILRDPGGRKAAAAWRTTGWPETFVVDRSGRIVRKIVGPARWDTAEATAWFRGVLKTAGAS
jgi:peroxiredoxin